MKYLINQDHPHLLNMGAALYHDQAHFFANSLSKTCLEGQTNLQEKRYCAKSIRNCILFFKSEKKRENVKTCVFDHFHGKLRFYDNKHV